MGNVDVEKVILGDVCKVSSGGTPNRKKIEYFIGGNIPWVKTGDLKGKYANKPSEMITELGLNHSSAKLFPPKTVLLAMYGATIGACSILSFQAATNQACAALLPCEKCDENYLYYYLSSIKQLLINRGVGGAQPNISAGLIKKLKIPLPPLPEQKRIATILDAADAYRQKTKALIAKYDELTQSLFLDMFGDPVGNSMGWEKVRLGTKMSVKHGFAFKSEFFSKSSDEAYVLLTPGNFFSEGGYKDQGIKQKYYNGDFPDEYLLNKNDLLLAMTEQAAGLLGCPLFVPEKNMFLHNQRLGLVKIIDSVNSKYLFGLFNSSVIRQNIHIKATGTKVRHTSPTKIQEIEVGVPPIKLQNQFAKRVQAIETQKAQAQTSLKKAEDLFNCLLQKAFKGELSQ